MKDFSDHLNSEFKSKKVMVLKRPMTTNYMILCFTSQHFSVGAKEENLKLETLKENVKSLKKKEVEALCALSEYDSSVHTSTQITDFYWHMENIYTSIVILRSQYRRDCQAINELFISAERKAMLDELIRSIGESLQQKSKITLFFLIRMAN